MDKFGLDSLLYQSWIDFSHEIQILVHDTAFQVDQVIGKLV